MRNMLHGVVVYLLFFTVQSSKGLTAIIKPNRTEFFFESGITPIEKITCESDCGNYNWNCTYSWVTTKNRMTETYIEKNNSQIETPPKENVTLRCYVEYIGKRPSDYDYSEQIKIFINERIFTSETSISDGKNDSNARTGISKEPKYAPRNITIRSYGDIDDLQEGHGYIEISCNADCNPECDRYQIYHNDAILNTSKDTRITKDRKNSGRYHCAASNSVSNSLQISTNSVYIDIKYAPSNVSIQYWIDSNELREGHGYIEISCNANCNPECDRYQIYHNGAILNASKDTRITKDRKNSGRYHCAASNSVSNRFQISTNSVDIDIKYAPGNVSIFYSSDDGDMQEGNGYIYITCYADCNPECDRYFIYHNGRRDNQTKEKWIKKDRTNSGLYNCEAFNSLGRSVSNTINISIHYTTVTLESNVRKLTINISDILPRGVLCRIDCNFPGCNSEIIVKRNSQPYRTIRSRNSIFENRAAIHSDDGTYACMVGNKMSENNFKLIIYHGPRITSVLRNNQTIFSGDVIEKEDTSMTISLNCSSSCNPPCKIAWYRDQQLHSKDNSIIYIRRDRGMSGVYHCEASGVEGKSKSAQVHVTIQYPPESVTITPINDTFYTKLHGKPVHDIICEANCVPECTYSWYRGRDTNMYSYTTGNSLFATKAYRYSGSSRFQCRASNDISPHRDMYSRWITVEVKDGPDNVTIIPSSSVKDNSLFQLTCSASCLYGCQSYVWFYKGKSMTQSTPHLTFPSLSKEDSGNYLCRVTDDFGWTDSKYYTLNVTYGPKNVTIQYSSSYDHLIEGQDYITFTCNADCNPECSYLFYQNGKLLNKTYKNEPVQRNMSGQYTCSARNSVVNTHVHSHNSVDVSIKYKPTITSFVNQKIITAPSLVNLTFSVGSFPSSNVTIFHGTNHLTFIPNVTGQLSFNVSIESCLNQGEYRVEAINDAGYDSFTFIADVKCSPIIVRHSNLSQKGYHVGDLLSYIVDYKAEPKAEVSWTFVRWNKKESKEIKGRQIQNKGESTMIEINGLNLSNFGKYKLELKNNLGNITHEFHIQGPPQRPSDLVVDCPHSAIISWRPGFDGGATQNFTIEYSDNSSYWLFHRPQSVVPVDRNFMSAHINNIQPNTPYSFRIQAENSFGIAKSDTLVNCTRQNIDEMASFIDNPNALVGIGFLVLLLLIATAALIVVFKLKRKRESNNQDNSLRKQGNNYNGEDNASEIVENILYITADEAKEQIQAPVDTTQNLQDGSDVYAIVKKTPKPDDSDDQPVYTDVCKSDQEKKKPAIAAKPSQVKKEERPTVNKDGLIYVDLDLKDAPSTSTGAFVIHGADDRTQYVDIDFTRRADPPPDTNNEECQNEKKKEKA